MSQQYRVGETLVWIHTDEETGQRVQEFVTVMGVRMFTGRPYYQIRSQRTGEPSNAWHDELYQFEK